MNERDSWDEKLKRLEHTRKWVQDLEDEEVSLRWRADLNRKLCAQELRKSKVTWMWKPALGLGLAAGLAFVLVIRPSQSTAPEAADPAIAHALLRAHHEALAAQDLGTAPVDTLASDSGGSVPIWEDIDLATL